MCGKDDPHQLTQGYEVSNSAVEFLSDRQPPIDTARSIARAFANTEELTKDLMRPLNIETLPGNVRLSESGAIRRLWAECQNLCRAA